MAFTYSYGDGCGMLYIKFLSLNSPCEEQNKKTSSSKYNLSAQIWGREKGIDKAIPIGNTVGKSLVFDGIVYYGNTPVDIVLKKKKLCGPGREVARGNFRLLNCIYKKWMIDRQGKTGDEYEAVTEMNEFTPEADFLTEKERIAYTLPLQKLLISLRDDSNNVIATVSLVTLFMPYALRKPKDPRPPLMHIAALYQDIPLLKRAIDVENRGELWNYNKLDPMIIGLLLRSKPIYEFVIQLREPHVFTTATSHLCKSVFHYAAMFSDHRFLRVLVNAMPNKQDFPQFLSLPDENDETPIFCAVRSHDQKMVQTLMKCGSLLDVRNKQGNTPLMVSITEKQEPIALSFASLSRMGPNHTRVYYAAPEVVNNQGQTALMLAAAEGMILLVHRLLHCHVSVFTIDCEGRNALQYALKAKVNQIAIVRALLGIKNTNSSHFDIPDNVNMELIQATFPKGCNIEKILSNCEEGVRDLLSGLIGKMENEKEIEFMEEDDFD